MGVVYIGDMPRCLVILCLLFAAHCGAAELSGRVIGISDGDTFTLLTSGKQQVKIRLAEIDAPEDGQPYGNRSKRALSGLIFGTEAEVQVQTKDRYGRTVGRAYIGDLDVCEEMIRIGAAWVSRDYVLDRTLFDVEKQARKGKLGLWGLLEAQRVEPWEWRREGNQEGAPADCNTL